MSRKGLGRGLQALIPEGAGEGTSEGTGVQEILLTEIYPNPDQPRKEFGRESLEELAQSLRVHGLLQPILVRNDGAGYMIIAGERRFRAAQLAGFEKIACLVQDCDEREMAERALVENIQRADLSPLEEGLAYARLIEEYELTQEQVAQRVGKSRPTITNLLRIIQLPEPVLELLRQERISLGHAKVLLGLNDSSLQVLLAQRAANSKLSVRETEELMAKFKGENSRVTPPQGSPKSGNPEFRSLEDRLRSSFQTKVKLKGDVNRGHIEIDYFSQEELNRLLELWNIQFD